MNTKATPKQTELAIRVLKHDSHEHFDCIEVTREERDTLLTKNKSRKWWILPVFVVDERYYCAWDVYYGHDIVVDLTTKRSYTSTNGIFESEFVFVSDYYGFSEGAFYYRAHTEPAMSYESAEYKEGVSRMPKLPT